MLPVPVHALLAIIAHITVPLARKMDRVSSLALSATVDISLMELIPCATDVQASAPLAQVSLSVQLVSIPHTLSTLLITAHSVQATSLLGLLASMMAQATLFL